MSSDDIFHEKWSYAKLPTIIPPQKKIDCSNLISIGSCFARNLTRWLSHYGYIKQQLPWDILYNPFSISAEIIRLFETVNWEKNIICEIDKGTKAKKYRDPWRTWYLAHSKSDLIEFNEKFDIIAKNAISKASGFLFTFGLSEVWSPCSDPEIVLNQAPIKSIISGDSSWSSRFASVAEVFQVISKLVKTIRKYFGLNFPIIFTLSPVPLKYTSLEVSIREANNISKSTILVALHDICRGDKNVFYYPSYETIQAFVEKKFTVWQKDGRHITADAIDIITQRFIANYDIHGKPKIKISDFWVPFVNEKGEVSGRLYVDGSIAKL